MSHAQYWKWKTAIADTGRFAAWSRDMAHLQSYMATPGKLLPWEVPVAIRKLESGGFGVVRELSENEWPPAGLVYGTMQCPEPRPFPPLLIRGSKGTGEPIFTPTDVLFNGDHATEGSYEDFHITFEDLKVPHEDGCRTNRHTYDILVRCALVRLTHYFPAVCLNSDGGKGDLNIPLAICRYVFEDEMTFPLWDYENEDV